ncbi:hypothetical protein RSOLAG22IIIB_05926 [Rhizoctonia solani]|uniref:Uncharacterized protein n=1 Tax=Rhizoctonia solani TaxID=456999 RepID=A0A0K6GAL8_9AGAM|nr:hypothetical protein RSOLAG22IIIB_05926 [Rhizoctonia solani]
MFAARRCLEILCILDEIIVYVDGKTILNLAVTCTWLWDVLKRSRVLWERALSNHQDFAPFPGAHLRTARTLVVLHFSSECVMCGLPTNNPILSNYAVRLCDTCSTQHLVAMGTHTIWQNGPHQAIEPVFLPDVDKMPPTSCMAQVYQAQVPQLLPANFDSYLAPQQAPMEQATSNQVTGMYYARFTTSLANIPIASPMEFYADSYMNPVYASSAEIDANCGFPTGLDDEEPEDFTGTPSPNNDPTDHQGPYSSWW